MSGINTNTTEPASRPDMSRPGQAAPPRPLPTPPAEPTRDDQPTLLASDTDREYDSAAEARFVAEAMGRALVKFR